ncbi:MAG: hypothetical protein ABJA67_15840 [Chthonomonadales bacterium]
MKFVTVEKMQKLACYVPKVAVLCILGLTVSGKSYAQTSAYYIIAGDDHIVNVVQGGFLQNTFVVPGSGGTASYPIAITNSVWLGTRNSSGSNEFTLGGVPTGNTGTGSADLDQLLDGTTDGRGNNYGVQCCTSNGINNITKANFDWSGQSALFAVPNNEQGLGIAFDTLTNHLFVGTFSGNLFELGTDGTLYNTFTPGKALSSLAYEQATDTLWSADNGGNTIHQISTTGVALQDIVFPDITFGNNFGGEMAVAGRSSVPEPGVATLAIGGLVTLSGLGFYRRRRK